MCVCVLSCDPLFATPWTVAHQAPLSMVFPGQGYWSGLPYPTPGALPHLGMEPKQVFGISSISRQILYHCVTWEAHI